MFAWLLASSCAYASLCPAGYALVSDRAAIAITAPESGVAERLNIRASPPGLLDKTSPISTLRAGLLSAAPSGTAIGNLSVPDDTLPDAPNAQVPVTERDLPVAILKDQIPIWTSPARVRTHDLVWLLPLGAAIGVTLATDTDAMRAVSRDRTFNKNSVNASNALLGSEIAIPVVLYGVGLFGGKAHARETGILSGEAIADGVIVEEIAKVIFRRERPLYNNAAGDFFVSGVGTSGSFPSSHSTIAWTLAGAVAGEYPSNWVRLGVYSMASGVSLTRVLGQEHFPADVLVGGAAGWLIGHYVIKKRQQHHSANSLPAVALPAPSDH
jgi:membrane-associated phospholipid phosphatase